MKKDLFDNLHKHAEHESLPEKHANRFADRLDRNFPQQTSYWKWQRILVAASVVFLMGISSLVYLSLHNFDTSKEIHQEIQPELSEAELYFQSELDTRIRTLSANELVDPELIAEFKTPDISFRQIKEDLRQNPGDSRLMDAVIVSYQNKIDVLDRIIEQLETYEN